MSYVLTNNISITPLSFLMCSPPPPPFITFSYKGFRNFKQNTTINQITVIFMSSQPFTELQEFCKAGLPLAVAMWTRQLTFGSSMYES